MTILYYDDDADVRELMEIILKKHFHQVFIKSIITDIIIEVQEVNPHLIIMDVNLPGINGESAIQLLKQDGFTKHIPVILISGDANLAAIAARSGADHYFEKPFLMDELVQKIKQLIQVN